MLLVEAGKNAISSPDAVDRDGKAAVMAPLYINDVEAGRWRTPVERR